MSEKESETELVHFQTGKGSQRPFIVTEPSSTILKSRSVISIKEKLFLFFIIFISTFVRFHSLGYPNTLVFQEAPIGNIIKKYVNGEFFNDTNPPLGKLLYAGIAYLFGYNGQDFGKLGEAFSQDIPYVTLRVTSSLFGVGIVLFVYLTLRAGGCHSIVSGAVAGLLAIENGNITVSRFYLLDSPLIFFIAVSIYSFKKFEIQRSFSGDWIKSLLAIGFGLGCTISTKWLGIGTWIWAIVVMVFELWFIWGDLTVNSTATLKHVIARGISIVGLPLVIYLAIFNTHINSLTKNSEESVYMSPVFRQALEGNTISKGTYKPVIYGSEITLRHINSYGGYLHSHNHSYETGSKQQQVTLYPYYDINNVWIVEMNNQSDESINTFTPLKDSSIIRLKHKFTKLRLHSHDHPPPVSNKDWLKEVSGYGYDGFVGDANDDFIIEVVPHASKKGSGKNVSAIDTVFRLRHRLTGCYLFSYNMKLPDYGFNQQEVSCAHQGVRHKSYWYVETNESPLFNETIPKVSLKSPTFWDKFKDIHRRMLELNNEPRTKSDWESKPTLWPLSPKGVNFWVDKDHQIYFLGNAIIWWSSLISTEILGLTLLYLVYCYQTDRSVPTNDYFWNYIIHATTYSLGWFLNWGVVFFIGKSHFIFQYLPALYFQLLVMGHTFEMLISYMFNNRKRRAYVVILSILTLSSMFFYHFKSLTWGGDWARLDCLNSKILSSWDFDCNIRN